MSFYMVNGLIQGSHKWHQWRRGVIGASDAPTIIGENPWKSEKYLMREKLGQTKPFSGNSATREGHQLEPIARKTLSEDFCIDFKPAVIQDADIPYLAASLDAISDDGELICEIKCGEKAYDFTKTKNKVPPYYMAQLQHMMMVSEHQSLVFAAFRPRLPLVTIQVDRDDSYIERIREAEISFMDELVSRGHQAQDSFAGTLVL